MSAFSIKIEVDGTAAAEVVQRVRAGLADRSPLHARIAQTVEAGTRRYLETIAKDRHRTAERLGAKPTGHLTRAASAIESTSDATAAFLIIPAKTALSRAFGEVRVTPKTGKMLAIPAHQTTYGKYAREFTRETFYIRFIAHTGRASLCFKSGPYKDEVGYWLVPSATLPADRTLLPSDDAWLGMASIAARKYIRALIDGRAAG
jgi:hypothetical protein